MPNEEINQGQPLGKGSSKDTKKKEEEPAPMTTLHERTIAMLSYLGPLAIVPFYLKKDSAFCRFHGKQGLLFGVIFFASSLFTVIDPIMDVMLIVQVVLFFYMGMAALSGKWKKAPLVYRWACQLEEVLTLKSKEEELEALRLKPEEVAPSEQSAASPFDSPEDTSGSLRAGSQRPADEVQKSEGQSLPPGSSSS